MLTDSVNMEHMKNDVNMYFYTKSESLKGHKKVRISQGTVYYDHFFSQLLSPQFLSDIYET